MIKIKRVAVAISASLFISGCLGNMPDYKSSDSSFITFKTPTIKYSDMGFISKANKETKVEIYSNGQSVMRLRVTNNQVCMSKLSCMNSKEFNKKVLGGATYPPDTLKRIFNGEEIFGGRNRVDMGDGFTQNIGSISYEVLGENISFRDSSTGTLIKIRKL